MTEINNTFVEQSMQAVLRYAPLFRLNRDETCDAQSIAWQFAQSERGTPSTCAWFAIKRVRSNRRFSESIRSIDSPKRRLTKSPVDATQLVDAENNPAKAAELRVDFAEWLAVLPDRLRQIATALASGDGTSEVATRLKCSKGRISQIRRELETHWREFRE